MTFSFSDIPVIYLIILVIGCIVLAAIVGLLCMCLCKYRRITILFFLNKVQSKLKTMNCLDTQYQRKRMGLIRNKLRGPDGQLNRLRY